MSYPGRLGHPGLQEVAAGLLTDHLRHWVLNAARESEADGEDSLTEVAGTIRQVIRR